MESETRSGYIETIVRLFFRKEKQERLMSFAAKKSRWADFRHDLLHDTRNVEPTTIQPIVHATTDTEAVARLLGVTAANKELAYCISDLLEIDDREMILGDALRVAMGSNEDTLVFCVRSRSAFYENHEGEQCILSPRVIPHRR